MDERNVLPNRGRSLGVDETRFIGVNSDNLVTICSQFPSKRTSPTPYVERARATCRKGIHHEAVILRIVIPVRHRLLTVIAPRESRKNFTMP